MTRSDRSTGPLSGVTVVDLSRALAGPYCSALLADLGARVIKVESVKGGDVTRMWPPFEGEHSLYFDSTNRSKESIAVDFYSESGRDVLERLIASADVLLENFRPGVMEKMGMAPSVLRERHPDLVIGSVTGFGNAGPLRDAAGLDQVAQGMSGLMSVTGPDAEHPYRFGVPIIDMVSGINCALGVTAALVGRGTARTAGESGGLHVTTSLLESALALAAFQGQKYLSTGDVPRPNGNEHASLTPYGAFRTADTPLIIAVGSEPQWAKFCDLIEAPELAADERFATGRARTAHREELTPLLEERLGRRTAAEWMPLLRETGIPCGPIYTYAEAFADEQVQALEMVQEVRRADGSALPLVRGPISLDGYATPVRSAPPRLGEHTRGVLASIGLDEQEVEDRLRDGVVAEPGRAADAAQEGGDR